MKLTFEKKNLCSYLKPSDQICCLRDCGHDVFILYIITEGWSLSHVCFWPNEKNPLEWNVLKCFKYAYTNFGTVIKL